MPAPAPLPQPEKLIGWQNYKPWKDQLSVLLKSRKCDAVVYDKIPQPSGKCEKAPWTSNRIMATSIIIDSLTEEVKDTMDASGMKLNKKTDPSAIYEAITANIKRQATPHITSKLKYLFNLRPSRQWVPRKDRHDPRNNPFFEFYCNFCFALRDLEKMEFTLDDTVIVQLMMDAVEEYSPEFYQELNKKFGKGNLPWLQFRQMVQLEDYMPK